MNHAIILAAGKGERFKGKQDKLLVEVAGYPLIYYTLIAFSDHPEIDNIILVASKGNKAELGKVVKAYRFKKVSKIIVGSSARQQSFESGFKELTGSAKKEDIVLVHNGANPLPSHEEISRIIEKTAETGACIVGHYIASTVKEIDGTHVLKTHDRKKLFAAQTPQAAKFNIFEKAMKNAVAKKIQATDEAMLLEDIGQEIDFIEASADNFKITTQDDFKRLQSILGDLPEDYRVGIGQDSHMFEDRTSSRSSLTLAGVSLPDHPKLEANSDGDVVLHAIFNAVSQAIGENSLGFYADPMCEKGVTDSKKYLEVILKKMRSRKFKLNSLGLMMECKVPKIDPLIPKLKKSLSAILDLDTRRVGITATSGENLTAFGSGLGIQCFAIVSLKK